MSNFYLIQNFIQSNNERRHNSPLYPKKFDSVIESRLNIDFTVNYWLFKGLAKEKLILGIDLHAQSYDKAKIGSKELTYTEVGSLISNNKLVSVYDKNLGVSYAYNDTKWISYEGVETLEQKALYVLDNQLAGIAFWDLQSDDYDGKLDDSNEFPLIKKVKQVYGNLDLILPKLTKPTTKVSTWKFELNTTKRAVFGLCFKGDGFCNLIKLIKMNNTLN